MNPTSSALTNTHLKKPYMEARHVEKRKGDRSGKALSLKEKL
jgi:hypothetical protein